MQFRGFLKHTVSSGTLAAISVFIVVVLFAAYHYPSALGLDRLAESATSSSPTSLLAATEAASASSTTTTSTASTTPSITPLPSKIPGVSALASAPAQNQPAASAPVESSQQQAQELAVSGSHLLKSMVNIVCVSADPSIPSISGSGVMIDSRGIILTAAHVAQFFLLQDADPSKVQCLVRAGSPARRAYLAEPIYVSPSWIANNPSTISSAAPKGTGENDFALLGITATATSTPLPSSFPFVPLANSDLQLGDHVAIGSYGAQYLTPAELNYDLYPILVFGTIQNRYTFTTSTVDLVTVVGSAASQEGSSGGGIVNTDGELSGTITTSSVSGDISSRSLNAITVNHMRRSYAADTGGSLDSLLSSNSVPGLIASFASESKILGNALLANIPGK